MNAIMLACRSALNSVGSANSDSPRSAVVGQQQQPRVDPVGQPAGEDRAGDVEEPDDREQARRRGRPACRGRARRG